MTRRWVHPPARAAPADFYRLRNNRRRRSVTGWSANAPAAGARVKAARSGRIGTAGHRRWPTRSAVDPPKKPLRSCARKWHCCGGRSKGWRRAPPKPHRRRQPDAGRASKGDHGVGARLDDFAAHPPVTSAQVTAGIAAAVGTVHTDGRRDLAQAKSAEGGRCDPRCPNMERGLAADHGNRPLWRGGRWWTARGLCAANRAAFESRRKKAAKIDRPVRCEFEVQPP